jgi:hypothetical protein
MKKIILIILLSIFVSSFGKIQSQDWSNFVQYSGVVGIITRDAMLQGEYGKAYKWLDMSLSITYETEGRNYSMSDKLAITNGQINEAIPTKSFNTCSGTAFSINARVDIVRLFWANSRHAFRVGGGLGCEFYQNMENLYDGRTYSVSMENKTRLLPNLRASYEFDITKKIALGAFVYAGSLSNYIDLSIRYNF